MDNKYALLLKRCIHQHNLTYEISKRLPLNQELGLDVYGTCMELRYEIFVMTLTLTGPHTFCTSKGEI